MTEIMTKNRETKSLLAKLMASENINVEYHESAKTAAFNTENRTLVMPVLKDMTENATDLFLGHEVGHALYTPQGVINDVVKKGPMFKGVVNIVEDARIEKMIQGKFPGLKRSFYNGYGDLLERGFFDIDGRDVNELNFIDRINIHFKIGIRAGVEFSDEEKVIVDKISNLRSWDDSLRVSEELFDYCKENAEPEPEFDNGDFDFDDDSEEGEDEIDNSGSGSGGGSFDDEENSNQEDNGETSDEDAEDSNSDAPSDSDESENTAEENNSVESKSDDDSEEKSKEEKTETAGGGFEGSDTEKKALESLTQESFDSALENHLDDSGDEYHYGIIPKVDIEKVLISMEDVHIEIDETITETNNNQVNTHGLVPTDFLASARESYNKFRSEQKSIISYMAKEFEMRKSADEHSRTREGKTGVLNPNKLHAYKFSEDIFLRSNIVAEGKNHGFVMFMDWSGSMAQNMANTLDQLTLLALFCKKVNIPFDVFAFTNGWDTEFGHRSMRYYDFGDTKDGDIGITKGFNLLHLISSTLSTAKFNTSMVYLRYLRESFARWGYRRGYDAMYYQTPNKLQLSGTPLNEAVISAMEIVPMFQKKNKVQIVNTIFLTDGQGSESRVTYDSETGDYTRSLGRTTKNVVVDRVTKRHYDVNRYGDKDTKSYLEALRDRTGSRIAGFFIAPYRKNNFRSEVGYLMGGNFEKITELHEQIKDNSYAVVEGDLGYEEFYILSDKNLNVQAAEVEFDSDMTKGRMKNAFVKSRKNKISNKAMLSRFAEFVS